MMSVVKHFIMFFLFKKRSIMGLFLSLCPANESQSSGCITAQLSVFMGMLETPQRVAVTGGGAAVHLGASRVECVCAPRAGCEPEIGGSSPRTRLGGNGGEISSGVFTGS